MGAIKEAFPGDWQRNIEYSAETVLSQSTVFRCINLISSDIGKMRLQLSYVDDNGIWTGVNVAAFSHVLRKPNRYQTRQEFIENWVRSKLIYGNAFILKERDGRGVVANLYVLDPTRVTPLVAPDGSIFYELAIDDLAGLPYGDSVPASEIIHDKFNCLYHPLQGQSPLMAAGLSANASQEMAKASSYFYANGSRPGGLISTPKTITNEQSAAIANAWNTKFTGDRSGKVAVLGDDLKYMPLSSTAVDNQYIETMKWNAEDICSVFGIPPHLVGVGSLPTYNNVAVLSQQYYSQCLQPLVNAIEDQLDEGLGLDKTSYQCEFDLDDLIRLDEQTLIQTLKEGVTAGIIAPNEARRRLNLAPKKGGDTPYMQQQNFSLEALDERDRNDPFAKEAAPTQLNNNDNEEDANIEANKALAILEKGLLNAI
ncbi:phage portal protein [Aureimonas altamirensis]|uniref:phage portal protein n=1 Tax=Aureimonas altamirensis TaxID=370622 RepID=UPI00301AFB98